MITMKALTQRVRRHSKHVREFGDPPAHWYLGNSTDESRIPASMAELGTWFDGDHLHQDEPNYGPPRPPMSPREEGGALPGLGVGYDYSFYVLASAAWMHANCAVHPLERVAWLNVLALYRAGKEPKWTPSSCHCWEHR